jgi:hypothetical protein
MTTQYVDETGYVWEERGSPPALDLRPGDIIEVRGAPFVVLSIHREIRAHGDPLNRVKMRGLDEFKIKVEVTGGAHDVHRRYPWFVCTGCGLPYDECKSHGCRSKGTKKSEGR